MPLSHCGVELHHFEIHISNWTCEYRAIHFKLGHELINQNSLYIFNAVIVQSIKQ